MRFAEGKGGEGSIILEKMMRFRKIKTRGLPTLKEICEIYGGNSTFLEQ